MNIKGENCLEAHIKFKKKYIERGSRKKAKLRYKGIRSAILVFKWLNESQQ